MQQPLVKLNEFHAVGGSVFHAHSEFFRNGYRAGNVFHVHSEFFRNGYRAGDGRWFYPSLMLNIHQPGETEEQAFYPAQSVSMRLTPQRCQELSAFFAKVARQLQGVE